MIEVGTHDSSVVVAEVDGIGFWSSLSLTDLLTFLITVGKYMVFEDVRLGLSEHTV